MNIQFTPKQFAVYLLAMFFIACAILFSGCSNTGCKIISDYNAQKDKAIACIECDSISQRPAKAANWFNHYIKQIK